MNGSNRPSRENQEENSMSDQFVDFAKSQMGAVERLLKGLPGIGGYIDKELRRDADKRVREGLARTLEQSKAELLEIQNRLLSGGGLLYMDDVDRAIVKLQTLIDRIKTAAYGYAGLFDAVRIKEDALDALHRFDVAMVGEVSQLNDAITALSNAVADNSNIEPVISRVTKVVSDLNLLYDKRKDAIMSPELLEQANYAPPVEAPSAALPGDSAASAADIANDPNAVG
jgi:hypothetical protein